MRRPLLLVAFGALLGAAAFASTHGPAAPAASTSGSSLTAPPRVVPHYGRVKSLTRKGSRFELRFDPAELLLGSTANRAAVEDKVIPPGDVVPNDSYVRDEGHKLLTYRVPADAKATVVVNNGTRGLSSQPVTVSELAQILAGKNPMQRKLMSRRFAFWIRVEIDTVRSLDQQYHP